MAGKISKKRVIKLVEEKFLKGYFFVPDLGPWVWVPTKTFFKMSFYKIDPLALSEFLERFYALCVYIEDSYNLISIDVKVKDGEVESLIFEFLRKEKDPYLKDFLIRYFKDFLKLFIQKEVFFLGVERWPDFWRFRVDKNNLYNCIDFRIDDDPRQILISWVLSIMSVDKRVLDRKFEESKIKELVGLLDTKDLKELYVYLQFIFDDLIKVE